MSDDIEDFARYLLLPEVNKAVVNALLDDYMAPADFVGEMKVLTVVMREAVDV